MRLADLKSDERGATAVEYALVLFSVLLVAAVAIRVLGGVVDCAGTSAAGSLQGGGGGACGGPAAVAASGGSSGSGSTASGSSGSSAGGSGSMASGPSGSSTDGTGVIGGAAVATTSGNPANTATNTSTEPSRTFTEQAQGTTPQRLDRQLLDLSDDVYDRNGTNAPVDGYTRVGAADLAKAGIDPRSLVTDETGFKAAVYTDGNGKYVVAFAGTDTNGQEILKDANTDINNGTGHLDAQYIQAILLAQKAKQAYRPNVVFTGHSLGGGLAATAALATSSVAVTYNAAGVNDATFGLLGFSPSAAHARAENGQVRSYRVEGEALTGTQRATSLFSAQAVGRDIPIPDPHPQSYSFATRLNPILSVAANAREIKHAGVLHTTTSLKEAIDKNPPYGNGGVTGSW